MSVINLNHSYFYKKNNVKIILRLLKPLIKILMFIQAIVIFHTKLYSFSQNNLKLLKIFNKILNIFGNFYLFSNLFLIGFEKILIFFNFFHAAQSEPIRFAQIFLEIRHLCTGLLTDGNLSFRPGPDI